MENAATLEIKGKIIELLPLNPAAFGCSTCWETEGRGIVLKLKGDTAWP